MKRACVLLAFAACDGLGAPVVDRVPADYTRDDACTVSARTCAVPFPAFEPVAPDQPLFESCIAGGTSASTLTVEGGAITHFVPLCAEVTIDLTGQAGDVPWDTSSVTFTKVHVIADTPVRLSVSASAVFESTFTLEGPVELSLASFDVKSSRFSALTEEASLAFHDVQATDVVIGDAETRVARVSIDGSTLIRNVITARELTVSTSALRRSELAASSLLAADLLFDEVELRTDAGQLASARGGGLYVAECGEFLLAGVLCADCELRGCRDADLLVDSGQFMRGSVLGNVTFKDGSLAHSILGQGEPTRVRMYDLYYGVGEVCAGTTGVGVRNTEPACIVCSEAKLDDPSTTCDDRSEPLDMTALGDAGFDTAGLFAAEDAGIPPRSSANPLCPRFDELPRCEAFPPSPRPF